jgi:ferric-dicitrate binding protein FerR (iron transport regulator)
MSNLSPREKAADWVVRINDPEVTEAELAQWEAWLAEDPQHCDLYQRLDHVWSRSTDMPQEFMPRSRTWALWKIAASVLLLVGGGAVAWLVHQSRPMHRDRRRVIVSGSPR